MDPTTDFQSFYGIEDLLDGTSFDSPRDDGSFVKQTLQSAVCPAGKSYCTEGSPIVTCQIDPTIGKCPGVDWVTQHGWYLDFPVAGERNNTSTQLVQGTLVVTTNRPQSGACVAGGISFRYSLDYESGGSVVSGSNYVGGQLGEGMMTGGPVLGGLPDGGIKGTAGSDNEGSTNPFDTKEVPTDPPENNLRRISWRELITE
jgi:type IV pilus assembly protein PilY1